MGQFYAYKNANPATRDHYPYLLDIQSDLLNELQTTVFTRQHLWPRAIDG
jgi:toxin CcdB